MSAPNPPPRESLSSLLVDKSSPLREYISETFPNNRDLQREYRTEAGRLLIPGSQAGPGTVGTAYDYLMRFCFDSNYRPLPALYALPDDRKATEAISEVVARAQLLASSVPSLRTGAPEHTLKSLIRACWGLALATEIFRIGFVPASPLWALLAKEQHLSALDIEGLAPDEAVEEISRMHELATKNFFTQFNRDSPVILGPTFDASWLHAADADLICENTLVELKTHLGPRDRRTGVSSDHLLQRDLHQILSYVLFDLTDTYEIGWVALYSARYACFVKWPLDRFLTSMAGKKVDLPTERQRTWDLLEGAAKRKPILRQDHTETKTATTLTTDAVMDRKAENHLEGDPPRRPADETVSFSLDGLDYEIDLSTADAEKLRHALRPYVATARRIPDLLRRSPRT